MAIPTDHPLINDLVNQPDLYLERIGNALHLLGKIAKISWADTDAGAVHLDPFPNPKPWLIAELGLVKIAIFCGPAGIGIGPDH